MPQNGTIPIIDIGPVMVGHDDQNSVPAAVLDATAEAIDRACRDVGFFAVVGHGVARSLRVDVIDAAKRFFALPEEVKQQVSIAASPNNRGFAGIGGEHLQADLAPDVKETFDIGLERALDDPSNAPLEGPNQWPDLDGFRQPLEKYQAEALSVAQALLRLMTRALDLPETFFDERTTRPQVNLRLVRYPLVEAQAAAEGAASTEDTEVAEDAEVADADELDELGCGAHSDYGCLTLLYSDGTPGLQLRRRDDVWIDVTVPPEALIVNLGDMLQRWTNDLYRSTLHRVISPTSGDRYSVPVFVNPNYHVDVTCVPSCSGPDRPARHEPVLAGQYLQSRFDDTFIYRRSDGESPDL